MEKQGKLPVNITANVLNLFLSMAIAVWLTPYLIRRLGVAAYGVIPLAVTATYYLSIITVSLNAAVSRFLTIEMERRNHKKANEIFNTSLFGSIALAIALIVPAAYVISFYSGSLFNLPKGFEEEAKRFFLYALLVFSLALASSPFEVATYSQNRFDLRNAISMSGSLLKVGLIIILFNLLSPRIEYVGISLLAAGVLTLFLSIGVWKYLTPALRIRNRAFNFETLRELTDTGKWISVNQIGTLLLVSVDVIVVNRLFGSEATGKYASILQWSVLLRGLGLTLSAVLGPTLFYYYARNDIEGLVAYCRRSVRFLCLFMALPVGLVCGLSEPLLDLWLGPSFAGLGLLLTIMTAHLGFNLGYVPLHNISTATKNVRLPGIVQLAVGVCNLLLAIFLARTRLGLYGIALAGGLMLTARNIVFTPLYSARIIGKKYTTFLREAAPAGAVTALVGLLSWSASQYLGLASWTRLVIFSGTFSVLYLTLVWMFFISTDDRKILVNMVQLKRI